MSPVCLICGSSKLAPVLDVGPQPIGNRFLRSPDQAGELFSIALQQCEACGLMQIKEPVPARALVPPFDWITYDEPEGHLDILAGILAGLPGIGTGSVAAGLSFKDDSLLGRLQRKGLQTWRLDIERDLGATHLSPGYGVETIQDRFTAATVDRALRHRKPADIVIARHILEHSSRPLDFVSALKRLTAPNGYLVVELPDCSRAVDGFDYTVIWEEHALYFTPDTFRQSLPFAGLDVVRIENYPYPFENSLVAITQARQPAGEAHSTAQVAARERARGVAFGARFPAYRDSVRRYLAERRRERGRIALFGAGHLACTWVNLMGVADEIDFIIDDNPHKQGLYMPGSRLPIAGSEALLERDITLCLLSLNPISEEKVVGQHGAFTKRGGIFASIFPASHRALRL
jgi:hypothetical protein